LLAAALGGLFALSVDAGAQEQVDNFFTSLRSQFSGKTFSPMVIVLLIALAGLAVALRILLGRRKEAGGTHRDDGGPNDVHERKTGDNRKYRYYLPKNDDSGKSTDRSEDG
jgi:hypothetical protein